MSQPRPFSFDLSFDDAAAVAMAQRMKRSYSPQEVEAIRQAAFREGEQAAAATLAGQQALALRELAESARSGLAALAQVAHNHRVQSATLAMACGRAIADAALDRFPEAPLRAALEALEREFHDTPRLTLRTGLAPDDLAPVVEEMARDIGYAGQVAIKHDAGLAAAAFSLDWGDGAAVFNPDATSARIADVIASALAADRLHADPIDLTPDGEP